jgi:hypothetical protein
MDFKCPSVQKMYTLSDILSTIVKSQKQPEIF